MSENYKPGLEGVIAGDTSVACVDQGVLLYRGYPIEELAEKATFEEVAYLLLNDDLPNTAQLDTFEKDLDSFRALPKAVVDALRLIPKQVPMMDVLRTTVSMTGHFDPVSDPGNYKRRAIWLTAQIGGLIAARYRLMNGQEHIEAKPGLSHAAQILYQAQGTEPDALSAKLLDITLILYAEHEFNASTFTARVICSTMSDLVSAIVGAIGALKGPLHGGANEAAMDMLKQFKSGDEAKAWIKDALANKNKVMGFGHRVYKNGDHRAHILERGCATRHEQKPTGMDGHLRRHQRPDGERKRIFPNVDYPCGLTCHLLGLPLDLHAALRRVARHRVERPFHRAGRQQPHLPSAQQNVGPASHGVTPLAKG